MTPLQLARIIQHRLEIMKWDGGSADTDKVLGEVVISELPPEEILSQMSGRSPFCIVAIGSGIPQDEPAGSRLQTITVTLVVWSANDHVGESLVAGANRQNLTTSEGRGLGEVEGQVLRELREMGGTVGVNTQARSDSDALIQLIGEGGAIIGVAGIRQYDVQGRCSDTESYPGAVWDSLATSGGDTITLSWTNPPDRYDFGATAQGVARGAMILRRALGATPPASPTEGTGVTIGAFDETVSDTPLASPASYSYALFATYDEDGDGTNERVSPALTVTTTLT